MRLNTSLINFLVILHVLFNCLWYSWSPNTLKRFEEQKLIYMTNFFTTVLHLHSKKSLRIITTIHVSNGRLVPVTWSRAALDTCFFPSFYENYDMISSKTSRFHGNRWHYFESPNAIALWKKSAYHVPWDNGSYHISPTIMNNFEPTTLVQNT